MCEELEIRDYIKEINTFQKEKVSSFEIINYKYIMKNNSVDQIIEFDKKILNSFFEKAFFKGKYICLKFSKSDLYLLCYCGNYGKWSLNESKYDKISISFKKGTIYFSDQKSFSYIFFCKKEYILEVWNKTGIDVLSEEFTREKFKELFTKKVKKSNSCISVSNLLMEQDFISGLRISLISDILYISNINPNTISKILNKNQINTLYESIKKIATERYMYKEKYQYKIYGKSSLKGSPVEIFQTKKRKIYWLPETLC